MVLQKMNSGSGSKVVKIVLLGFLFMAVAGLVLADVQGFFRGGLRMDTVAKGGGIRVSTQEFDQTVRRVLASQGMSPQDAYRLGLIDQILQSEIQARLLVKQARDLGLVVGDDAVKAQIAKIAAPLAQGGRSVAESLQMVLRSQGISENQFIASVREEMAIGLLRDALASGAGAVSDDMAQALYRSEKETRAIEAVVLSASGIKDIQQPTEDNLKTYYEANKLAYATPETRTATYAFLSEASLPGDVAISDQELKAAYDQNIAAYQKPSQREIEQSVFADQKSAEAALKALKDGKALKEASGASYLGKNAFAKEGLMAEVAEPVFSGKPGDIVGPIQTALGWHVIIVGADKGESTTPFEKVKETLRRDLTMEKMVDAMINTANEIDDRLAGGESLDTLVKEYNLTTQKIGPFRQTGFNGANNNLFEKFGTDAGALIDAAFSHDQGEIAPVVELGDGRYAITRIDEAKEVEYKPFEEVKAELKDKWIAEQRAVMNRARAQDALTAAEKGEKLADIATKNNATLQNFKSVTRTDSTNKSISPIALAKIFTTDKGGVLLAENDKDIVLIRVTGISIPDGAKASAAELKDIKERIAREQVNEVLAQYLQSRSANTTVRVNQAVLKQLYAGEQG